MSGAGLPARALVSGRAQGATFVLQEPLSFWGGLDSQSGRIIDRWHKQHGQTLSSHILVMSAGRGSSSGSSVLAESIRLHTGPSGIVLLTPDAIVTVGAMIAAELYDQHCPVVVAGASHWPLITNAAELVILASEDPAEIRIMKASDAKL